MGQQYLYARQVWAGGMADNVEKFEKSLISMRDEIHSPWNLVAWELPLHRDW